MNDNVIQFPLINKRFDLTGIPIELDDLAENIKKLKFEYFSEVSRTIVDQVINSIMSLEFNNESTLSSKDIILIKESISAALCRLAELEHPLHELGEENIILTKPESENDEVCVYRFKSDPITQSLINFDTF